MDHGVLNIPLAKRGDINAQLDAYKATKARADKALAKQCAAELRANRVRAAAVLDALPAEQVERIAAKASITVTQARKQLKSMAYFTPLRIIALVATPA